MRLVLGIALSLSVASTALAAPAKPPKITPAAKKIAKEHFDKGQTAFKLGRFDEALSEFSAAYEAAPMAAFLYNLGQCHRQMKNWERAKFFFEGYLRELPDAPNRDTVEELVAETQAELDKAAAAAAAAPPPDNQAQKQAEAQAAEDRAARIAAEAKAAEAQQQAAEAAAAATRAAAAAEAAQNDRAIRAAAPPPAEPFYSTWWFWTGVGVVVAAGATTAVLFATRREETHSLPPPSGTVGVLDRRQALTP